MITKISNKQIIEFLKEIGVHEYETIIWHYGDQTLCSTLPDDTLEIVIKHPIQDGYQALKFNSLGLCNFSNITKDQNNLEYKLSEDNVIDCLFKHDSAIKINKTLYNKIITSKNIETIPSHEYAKIASEYFAKQIAQNLEEIRKFKEISREFEPLKKHPLTLDEIRACEAIKIIKTLEKANEKLLILQRFMLPNTINYKEDERG